jgi:hypothetical protein
MRDGAHGPMVVSRSNRRYETLRPARPRHRCSREHPACPVAARIEACGTQLVVGPAFGFTGRRLFAMTDEVRRLELLRAEA